jgi:hypothetical protein
VAREIDRKLRLTAALLGTVARKDLAAAFRRVNANTSFEIGRADKWLRGLAQPREMQVYADWAKVLDLDRSGQWIADCDAEVFLDEICLRHGRDRETLLRAVEASGGRGGSKSRAAPELAGTFVCYSHAWSPYFRGQLIRGELTVGAESSPNRSPVSYTEVLPTGAMKLSGVMLVANRGVHIQVSEAAGSAQLVSFCLFQASPPASVLGGLMFGTTRIGPDAQPSVTRIVMVRLAASNALLRSKEAYLSPGSIAGDLAELGLDIEDPAATDRLFTEFLTGNSGGFDQVPVSTYRALADVFDRRWLSAAR